MASGSEEKSQQCGEKPVDADADIKEKAEIDEEELRMCGVCGVNSMSISSAVLAAHDDSNKDPFDELSDLDSEFEAEQAAKEEEKKALIVKKTEKKEDNDANAATNNKHGKGKDKKYTKKHQSKKRLMVQCVQCKESFHLSCIPELSKFDIRRVDFHCPQCQIMHGPTKRRVKVAPHRFYMCNEEERGEPPLVCSQQWIADNVHKMLSVYPAAADVVIVCGSSDEMKARLAEQLKSNDGWTKALLVRREGMEGTGLKVKIHNFADLVKKVGERKLAPVIDVHGNHMSHMRLGKYMAAVEKGGPDMVLNMLSLEISNDTPTTQVFPPDVAINMDIVTSFLKCRVQSLARVREWYKRRKYSMSTMRYCLVSMNGAYTDFHLDFSGTAVWYFVEKGKKVFLVAPGTPRNMRVYEEHQKGDGTSWMGDQLQQLVRVEVNAGDLLLLPAGYIHAVFTPEKSLVFGGNFLNQYNIAKHIQVHEMELRLGTTKRFRLPCFELLMYFAATQLLARIQKLASGERLCRWEEEGVAALVAFLPGARAAAMDVPVPDSPSKPLFGNVETKLPEAWDNYKATNGIVTASEKAEYGGGEEQDKATGQSTSGQPTVHGGEKSEEEEEVASWAGAGSAQIGMGGQNRGETAMREEQDSGIDMGEGKEEGENSCHVPIEGNELEEPKRKKARK